jgi:hypothetical protein
MLNKRSVVISSRFSGDQQDIRIKESTNILNQIESEQSRLQTTRKNIMKEGGKTSSSIVDNGKPLHIDKLLEKLDTMEATHREKVLLMLQSFIFYWYIFMKLFTCMCYILDTAM